MNHSKTISNDFMLIWVKLHKKPVAKRSRSTRGERVSLNVLPFRSFVLQGRWICCIARLTRTISNDFMLNLMKLH